jgi:superfamily I DNA/RNA helicase
VRIGAQPTGLLERVVGYIHDTYDLDVGGVPASALDDGRAEVRPADGCLLYDEALDTAPAEKLLVIVHELAHLERHGRLTHRSGALDPIFGSIYVTDGGSALARYSPRSAEETEANTFAKEFICPAGEVLSRWRENPAATAESLAVEFGVPPDVVRVQLADGLYALAVGASSERAKPDVALNDSQRAAASYANGPALIDAGPGTGKTATLVHRVNLALGPWAAEPESLLVLTFSNEAAEELRLRIAQKFGADRAARVVTTTFHGFGAAFLRDHGHLAGVDANASIIDESVQIELVMGVLGGVACDPILNLKDPGLTAEHAVRQINFLKDRLIDPEMLEQEVKREAGMGGSPAELAAQRAFLAVYREYEARKAARQSLDFGDLIAIPLRVLRDTPEVRDRIRQRYRWVMVDEYQDVGRAVALLLQQIAGPENPPWVVGDLRQAIYLFRGAAPENVLRFEEDFPGAERFELDTNYRSCAAVIEAANQLATIMHEDLAHHGLVRRRGPQEVAVHSEGRGAANASDPPIPEGQGWKAGRDVRPIGPHPIIVARATSDRAEYDGIADQVREWLNAGVAPGDIAVLARRNIDVRNIVLALGERDIRAMTAGLVTPEGPAGDLAAALTFGDAPIASLPRVAYALTRDQHAPDEINAAIRASLAILQKEHRGRNDARSNAVGAEQQEKPDRTRSDESVSDAVAAIVAEVFALLSRSQDERYRADGLSALIGFLFDTSQYLRRVLDTPDEVQRSLALCEIVTTLALAAAYRFCHDHAAPRDARINFAEYFRTKLLSTIPSLLPPMQTGNAVRVMTCHASKGLEFPCVIVAGQTLPDIPGEQSPWLPHALRPVRADDRAQADSLFFVGLTRAERAVVVSYAESRSGSPRRRRKTVPLLERWRDRYGVTRVDWTSGVPDPEVITLPAVWGSASGLTVGVWSLDAKACPVKTYVEDDVGVRFPTVRASLYRVFIGRVRRVLQQIVRRSIDHGTSVGDADAAALFQAEWPLDDQFKDHPHLPIYRPRAERTVVAFARAFAPPAGAVELLDVDAVIDPIDGAPSVKLDLVAYFRCEDGAIVGMQMENDSLVDLVRAKGVLWSGLKSYRRLPFVLLRRRHRRALRPYVFSLADGRLYPFQWATETARDNPMEKEASAALERLAAFAERQYETTISDWTCDRCGARIVCPYWIGAATETAALTPLSSRRG